jgi:hypothetical protein
VVQDSSVEALAKTLQTAVTELRNGDKRGEKLIGNEALLQSSLTKNAVAIYAELLAKGGKYTS